jgi:Calcium-dependent channel, 7TM region, putative phosphate
LTLAVCVQGVKLIMFIILGKLASSRRALKRTYATNYFNYGMDVAYTSLIFMIMLIFCALNPFVTVAAVAYFAVNYCFTRYDLLFFFREQYQSGGMFWPVVRTSPVASFACFALHTHALRPALLLLRAVPGGRHDVACGARPADCFFCAPCSLRLAAKLVASFRGCCG